MDEAEEVARLEEELLSVGIDKKKASKGKVMVTDDIVHQKAGSADERVSRIEDQMAQMMAMMLKLTEKPPAPAPPTPAVSKKIVPKSPHSDSDNESVKSNLTSGSAVSIGLNDRFVY
jgi:hypothetical protein